MRKRIEVRLARHGEEDRPEDGRTVKLLLNQRVPYYEIRFARDVVKEAEREDDGGDFVKTVTVRDLQKNVKECVDGAQTDRVIITRHGRPAAVLVGVEGDEREDVLLQTDPTFWKLIRARRRQPTISLAQLKQRLRVKSK